MTLSSSTRNVLRSAASVRRPRFVVWTRGEVDNCSNQKRDHEIKSVLFLLSFPPNLNRDNKSLGILQVTNDVLPSDCPGSARDRGKAAFHSAM